MNNTFHKDNSENSTASAAMSLVAGSRGWGYEPKEEAHQCGRSMRVSSASDPARNPAPISMSGTGIRPANNSMEWATHEQMNRFSVRESGNIGQEVLDADGNVVLWTTSPELAHRIVRLLNEDG